MKILEIGAPVTQPQNVRVPGDEPRHHVSRSAPGVPRLRLLIFVVLALPAVARAQFVYIVTNGTITVTSYTGSGGDVTIPSETNGLPVTAIGDGAFDSTGLGRVVIPEVPHFDEHSHRRDLVLCGPPVDES